MIVWRNSKTSKDFNFTISKSDINKTEKLSDNSFSNLDDFKSIISILNTNLIKMIKRVLHKKKDISWRYLPDLETPETSKNSENSKISKTTLSIDTSSSTCSRTRLESDSEYSNCTGYSTCGDDDPEESETERDTHGQLESNAVGDFEPMPQNHPVKTVGDKTKDSLKIVNVKVDPFGISVEGKIGQKSVFMRGILVKFVNPKLYIHLKCSANTSCTFKGKIQVVKEKVWDIATQAQKSKKFELVKDVDKISTYEPEIIVETPHSCLQLDDDVSTVPSTEQTKNQPSCSNLDSGRCLTPKSISPEIGRDSFGSENEDGFLIWSQKF